MKAELVYKRDNACGGYRVYKLSEPITKGHSDLSGDIDIKANAKGWLKIVKPEFENAVQRIEETGLYYVTISDAYTHIERLVFPALDVKLEDGSYASIMDDIGGKHTFMTQGGDADSVYPDEVYLRRLAQLNNLKWEGVEQ